MKIYSAIVATVVLVAASGAALAQTAAAGADPTSITVKPLVEFIQPYLTATATVVAPIIAYWIAMKVSSFLGVSMNATQVARLKSAAATEAGALVANAADNLANKTVPINDPRIVNAANSIIAKLPDTAAAVGATPDTVAKMVQGELGKLQAGQVAADPIVINKAV